MAAKTAKPRKKAAKPSVSFDATPNDLSDIYKLITRYRFLEAEQEYQSAAAATGKESDRLGSMHAREIEMIRGKLASAVPGTFNDARELLQFAVSEVHKLEGLSNDGVELQIIENVAEALENIRNDFAKAVRDAGYDLMLARMADVVNQAKTVKPLFYQDVLGAVKI